MISGSLRQSGGGSLCIPFAPKEGAKTLHKWLSTELEEPDFPLNRAHVASFLSVLEIFAESPAQVIVWQHHAQKKRYLTTLRDYVLLWCANVQILGASARDFRVQRATFQDEMELARDSSDWCFVGHFDLEVEMALESAYDDWICQYPPNDGVPNPEHFLSVFEETIAHFPRPGHLLLPEDRCVSFDDMRKAALLIRSGSQLAFEDGSQVNFYALSPAKVQAHFDVKEGCSPSTWNPDQRQWSQMCEECVPRAEWTEMLRAAGRVVTQKRLKRDGTLE